MKQTESFYVHVNDTCIFLGEIFFPLFQISLNETNLEVKVPSVCFGNSHADIGEIYSFEREGGQDAHYLNNVQKPNEMFFKTNVIQVAVQ